MTKLEKNLLNAMEDAAITIGKKTPVEDIMEDGKSFFVKYSTTSLSLYWGEEKVINLDKGVYMALAAKIFSEYIKF